MATIAEIITNGEISVPLALNYNSEGSLFGKRLAAPKSPVLIQMVTDALTWMDDGGNYTDAEEESVANYLVWLCGKFGLQAAGITGSGGSVTPIPPGGLSPSRIDFVVSSSSYMVTGATTATITSFIGREIDFIRNGISQSTLSSQPSYITWTQATGVLVVSPALVVDEVIAIIPS